jgi:hypothetical protein
MTDRQTQRVGAVNEHPDADMVEAKIANLVRSHVREMADLLRAHGEYAEQRWRSLELA